MYLQNQFLEDIKIWLIFSSYDLQPNDLFRLELNDRDASQICGGSNFVHEKVYTNGKNSSSKDSKLALDDYIKLVPK